MSPGPSIGLATSWAASTCQLNTRLVVWRVDDNDSNNKLLLRAYYVLGIALGPGYTGVNKDPSGLCSQGAYSLALGMGEGGDI